MILLIIEFVFVSRYLNSILSEEKKKILKQANPEQDEEDDEKSQNEDKFGRAKSDRLNASLFPFHKSDTESRFMSNTNPNIGTNNMFPQNENTQNLNSLENEKQNNLQKNILGGINDPSNHDCSDAEEYNIEGT